MLILLVAAFFLYAPRDGNAVAVISVDGEELRRIDLAHAENETFSIAKSSGKPVSFQVENGAIRFVQVDCPDHLCEKSGWCDAPGERAVCMPNRTTLICYNSEELPANSN